MMLGLEGAYDSQITSALPQYCPSCPASMVLSLVQTESSGNPNAVSPAGAIGLFQLMPATAASLNVDPNTVTGNIQGGETYLQQLYDQFGNWDDALMAYNEGPTALQAQLNAGTTPTSTAYAATILQNAGMSDSSTSSTSDTSDSGTDDSSGDDSSSSLWGLSTGSLIAIALGVGLLAYELA
jgi:hypothetical protein